MKRSPLRRRGKRRFPDMEDTAYLEAVATLPCCVCRRRIGSPQYGKTVAAHVLKTRGTGGDDHDTIPLCVGHETLRGDSFHQMGVRSFAAHHDINYREEITRTRHTLGVST